MRSLQNQMSWCARTHGILTGLLAGGAVMFFFFGYRPRSAHLADVRSQIAMVTQELEANRMAAATLPNLELEVLHLRAEMEGSNKQLSRQSDFGPFMTDIANASKQSNVRKLAVTPGLIERHDQDLFEQQPINITFEGDFISVFTFLRQIEDMPRLTRVQSLNVSGIPSQNGDVDVHLSINGYFSEE
jgi:Tfp pilus assembly protein PilO